jgi:hypothetical protein
LSRPDELLNIHKNRCEIPLGGATPPWTLRRIFEMGSKS